MGWLHNRLVKIFSLTNISDLHSRIAKNLILILKEAFAQNPLTTNRYSLVFAACKTAREMQKT